MIAVYEGPEIPDEIAAVSPGAPAYLVVDPSQGAPQARAEVEREIRSVYKRANSLIFGEQHRLPDGRLVYVGQKINPLLAHGLLGPNPN